jgi:hypothetical protein
MEIQALQELILKMADGQTLEVLFDALNLERR